MSEPGVRLDRARSLAEEIAEDLGGAVAGDAARWRDRCVDVCVVCPSVTPAAVVAAFAAHRRIGTLLNRSASWALGVSDEGVPVEVFVVSPHRFGDELIRRTGTAEYVRALEPLPAGRDEREVFRRLGMPYRPPELRERASQEPAPPLVEVSDLRGDMHCHSTWSDGTLSLLQLGMAAAARGYEYAAVCDHTPGVGIGRSLRAGDVLRQAEAVAAANAALAPFRLLHGIECDIRLDGSLDLPDFVLAQLDWVQISVHLGQRQPRRTLTSRVIAAMRHPGVRVLSHPTGRLYGRRPENGLDLDRVFAVARETGVALEVNARPERLDLRDEHIRDALSGGVRLVVSTDAHRASDLDLMRLGVATARRGGATLADVVNTRPLAELLS